MAMRTRVNPRGQSVRREMMKPSKGLDEQIDEILEGVFSQGVRAGKDIALEKYEDYNAWKKGDEKQQLLALIEQCAYKYAKGIATEQSHDITDGHLLDERECTEEGVVQRLFQRNNQLRGKM